MRSLDEIIAAMPADERAHVEARGAKLVAEERALRHLRLARDYTQANMATVLGIDRASVSRIEKTSDMLISTMRNFVEAMGGSLKLVAEFSDGAVEIASLEQLASTEAQKRRSKKPREKAVVAAKDPAPV